MPGRRGQVRVARDRAAVLFADQVVDAAADIRLEHLEREIRQVDFDLAVAQARAFTNRFQRERERAVERDMRRAHRAMVGQPRIEREQADERQEEP